MKPVDVTWAMVEFRIPEAFPTWTFLVSWQNVEIKQNHLNNFRKIILEKIKAYCPLAIDQGEFLMSPVDKVSCRKIHTREN